ncbi:alcohol oxidase [Lentinus brumalis]|uniref:Alcohol oxidase n=1 Tax=Lentinus brumalis TaxID=2498619 RepID=A0A371CZ63_9APHY|nr:alcohol oxidase [Polyporus brumalis]
MHHADRLATVACAVLALAVTTSSAVLLNPADLPAHKQYDYIVVGAGPGGSTVANRLSEDPHINVLLIEAGPSDEGVLAIEVPFLASQLQPNTPYDWNYTTTPQQALNGRVVSYARGHVLGGSSSINLMVWTRSSRDDFNSYAAVAGDPGWSWDSIEPYFSKVEHIVPPTDGHNTAGEIAPHIHSHHGYVNITLPNAKFPSDSHAIATTQDLPDEFPFNLDSNSGNPIGLGWTQGTYGNGRRSSAASSYINPFLYRANLDVLVNTTATKLVQTGHANGRPAFRAVEVKQSSTSRNYTLHAATEIILSAGAINTPKLLMLSGIGPGPQLHSLGIAPIVDNSHIGQHLVDHPRVSNQFGVSRPEYDITDTIGRNTTLFDALLQEWQDTQPHRGFFANGGSNQVGWFRIPQDDPIWDTVKDPSTGPTSPHYEFLFRPGFASTLGTPAPPGNFLTVNTVVVAPSSSGSVTLASADPFDPPLIDPNFLNTTFDIYALRTAIRAAARFLSAPTWEGFITGQAGPFADVDLSSDDAVDTWARAQVSTIWHPVGTARMGACGDETSVVDPDLRVKGVEGVRVVDASVFPTIPAAHPQAVVYVFAERAADLIKHGRPAC